MNTPWFSLDDLLLASAAAHLKVLQVLIRLSSTRSRETPHPHTPTDPPSFFYP